MTQEVPQAVMYAKTSDGKRIADIVHLENLFVDEMTEVALKGFQQTWTTRRDIDIPIWIDLGRLDAKTAKACCKRITALLDFVDRAKDGTILAYNFSQETSVLFASETSDVIVVDLPKLDMQKTESA